MPTLSKHLIVGTGNHGISTAWHLAWRLLGTGKCSVEDIVILDNSGIEAGTSGIAFGVVRRNCFQPTMRRLKAYSADM
jgi:glycine/D-amino acid oxidase-like deaminating enzyme